MNTFLKSFAFIVKKVLKDLYEKTDDPNKLNSLLLSKGWLADIQYSNIASIQSVLSFRQQMSEVVDSISKIERADDSLELLLNDAIPLVKSFLNTLNSYSDTNTSIFPFNQSSFWSEFSGSIFDDLLIDVLKKERPLLASILELTGIIKIEKINPVGAGRVPYYKKTIVWSNIGDFILNPTEQLKSVYGWNETSIDYDLMFATIGRLFRNVNIDVRQSLVKKEHFDRFYSGYTGNVYPEALEILIWEKFSYGTANYRKASISIFPAKAQNSNQLKGLQFVIEVEGMPTFSIPVSPEILLKGSGYLGGNNYIGFAAYPDEQDRLYLDTPTTSVAIGASFSFIMAPYIPWLLFGKMGGTGLMMNGVEASIEMRGSAEDPEMIFSVGTGSVINQPNFLFTFEPGDNGFLNKILGDKPFSVPFAIGLQWSSKRGISFKGGGGFEMEFPISKPKNEGGSQSKYNLSIPRLRVGAYASTEGFSLKLGMDITTQLGFIGITVENIGATALLKSKNQNESKGLLNNLDFDLEFAPPDGIGLTIDAKGLRGGGYLYFNSAKGEYYGALELEVFDKIKVSAIGIITTKDRNSSNGFSLLILVNTEFPGIPLGFGFSLNGIGGMAAVNRSQDELAIQAGVQTGSINSIMFPSKAVENLPAIVSDLKGFFPVKDNAYTFGLFFLIKWGPGIPLIDIKLGFIVSYPDPLKVSAIGVASVVLPIPETPVIKINVAFRGTLNLDQGYLAIDASIYDSRMLFLSLAGGIHIRFFWKRQKEMLISVGGFHPAYETPGFLMLPPSIQRMEISLFDSGILTLVIRTYFAVTSNTVQFGADVNFKLSVAGFKVQAWFDFDALFMFNPFRFQFNFNFGAAVSLAGVELMCIEISGELQGPGPWYAMGRGKIKMLLMSYSANFEETWGERPDTKVPEIEVRGKLHQAFEDNENWQTTEVMDSAVKFLPVSSSSAMIFDAKSRVNISQKVLPLNILAERYGGQKVKDKAVYTVSSILINNEPQLFRWLTESFAPAQYRDMDEKTKLISPSFENLASGVSAGWGIDDITTGEFIVQEYTYDLIVVDSTHRAYMPNLNNRNRILENVYAKAGDIMKNDIVVDDRNNQTIAPGGNVMVNVEPHYLVVKGSLNSFPGVYSSRAEALSTIDVLSQNNNYAYTRDALMAMPV